MGCFNVTCAISHMPIKHGDDVVFLILEKSKDGFRGEGALGGYPTHFWTPYMLPVYAKYNDYGSIENWQDSELPVLDFIVKNYKKNLFEDDAEDENPDDIDNEDAEDALPLRSDVTFPLLQEWFHEGKVFTQNYMGKRTPNNVVMIRRGIWDAILSKPVVTRNDTGLKFSTVVDSIDPLFEVFFKAQGDDKYRLLESESKTPYLQYMTSLANESGSWFSLLAIKNEMYNVHNDPQLTASVLPQFKLFLTRMAEVYFVNKYFDQHRLTWHPVTGTGQDRMMMLTINHHMMCIQENLKVLHADHQVDLCENGVTKKKLKTQVTLEKLEEVLAQSKETSSPFTLDKYRMMTFNEVKNDLKQLEKYKKMFE